MTASFLVSNFEVSTLADVQALRTLVQEGESAQKVGVVMQNRVHDIACCKAVRCLTCVDV